MSNTATNTTQTRPPVNTYLKEITLTNWRQYEGTQTIDLAPTDDKSIAAIIGKNGTGKTNLAKAVSACLNGYVPVEDVEDGEPYVNSSTMQSLSPGETVKGAITLRLTHQGTDYDITREFKSTKQPVGCENTIEDELTVEKHVPQRGWEPVEHPNTMLGRILPPEVQKYYFFDGERLDQLFKPGYESKVKEAVYQLSHIEALDRGIKHLGTLRDERRRTAKSKNGEVDRYRKKLAGKHEEQRDIEHDKATVEQRLRAKQRALQEVEDDMGVASDPTVMKLRTRRERLEAEIERVEDAQAALEETLNEHLVTAGTILFASDALDDATTQLEQLDAQGHLPPDIRRSFLTARLEEDTCICGCDLEKHPQRRQAVKTLRDETPNISERTIDASYAFPQTQAAGVESFQALRATRKELRDNQQTKLQLEQDREELSQELRGKDIPEDVDLEALDEQREQLRAELRRLQNKNGRFEERLEAKKAEVEAAKERVETELAKESRSQELMEEVEFYKRARARLQSIKASLMAEVRSDIESSLDAYYNELTWKSETYELSLADDFRIHIEGPDSLRQVERLSAGETEILALSFIAALTEVSGFDAPVLIDTPLGRIDKAHRGAIARKLPEYLAGHQVTFLFTDSEYDDVVEPILDGNLAKTHKLENDNRVTDVDNVTT